MFDAREFLRKKLIGQNVHVIVDYIQPASDNYPEKTCGTITIGGVNVAEALVSKGTQTLKVKINSALALNFLQKYLIFSAQKEIAG